MFKKMINMTNNDLKLILRDLDNSIDTEMHDLFESSSIYPIFSGLVKLCVFDDGTYDEEVMELLNALTDNLDSLNFDDAKCNIEDILELL